MNYSPLVIGLTGGIASGKTTVARMFAEQGVPIIDADEIAHELVKPDQPALQRILVALGTRFLMADGTLDRAALRRHVFQDATARQTLENILHPLIRQTMLQQVEYIDKPYCIFSIPLLIESAQQHIVQRILVVDCPPEMQRIRLRARSHLADEEIDRILLAQATRETRLAVAQDIIQNGTDDMLLLKTQVDVFHQHYLDLASMPRSL